MVIIVNMIGELSLLQYATDFGFVTGLMMVGAWLESTGGKDGWVDEWLTPLPLGLSGIIVCIERAWT
jgi:hypothetical protein